MPADAPAPAHRHVAVPGCYNFRDLGGYRTVDGRRVRWRRLFRADGLAGLGADGRHALAGLGVVSVLDLRSPEELASRGRLEDVDGVRYHHFPFTQALPGTADAEHWQDHRFVSDRYLGMLADAEPSVAAAIETLAAPGSLPAVFHCSAGKDRTGVLAALVLGLLGVPDDDIVADYALSRHGMERFVEAMAATADDEGAEILRRYQPVILSAEPASMAGFIAGVHAAHGSFAGLAAALGVEEAAGRLRAELLEPA